VLSGE
jgi:hypothetical protein